MCNKNAHIAHVKKYKINPLHIEDREWPTQKPELSSSACTERNFANFKRQ